MKSSNCIFGNPTPDPIKMPVTKPCSSRLLGRPVWCVGAPETRCGRPGEMPLHNVRLVPGRPTGRTTGASALPSAYIPTDVAQLASEDSVSLMRARSAITISWQSRDLDPEFVAGFAAPSPRQHKDPPSRHRHHQPQRAQGTWHNALEPSKAHTWACGIMYALDQLNFLSDRAKPTACSLSEPSCYSIENTGFVDFSTGNALLKI
jgi:hypothetical protein